MASLAVLLRSMQELDADVSGTVCIMCLLIPSNSYLHIMYSKYTINREIYFERGKRQGKNFNEC